MGSSKSVIHVIVGQVRQLLSENFSSLASSSAWKRRFSSSSVWPFSSLPAISSASTPTQSGQKPTFSLDASSRSSIMRSRSATGLRLIFGLGLPFGRPKVRGENQARAMTKRVFDGGKCFSNARVVHNPAVVERNVEIDTHENRGDR